jgi:hypothetical protein
VPQEIADFLERRVFGEVVDVVSAIREHALFAVEIANRGGRNDDIFEAGLCWCLADSHYLDDSRLGCGLTTGRVE